MRKDNVGNGRSAPNRTFVLFPKRTLVAQAQPGVGSKLDIRFAACDHRRTSRVDILRQYRTKPAVRRSIPPSNSDCQGPKTRQRSM